MTEWEKFKVVELKEECKARQISITGLKLKQQYIDKLVEYESSLSQDAAPAEESVAEKTNGAIKEVEKDDTPAADTSMQQSEEKDDEAPEDSATENLPLAVENDENLPQERPIALKKEDSNGLDVEMQDENASEPAEEAANSQKDVTPTTHTEQPLFPSDDLSTNHSNNEKGTADETDQTLKEAISGPEPTPIVDMLPDSDTPDLDSRKRKRRSETPSVDPEEISKRAKLQSGAAIPTKRGSRSPSPRPPTPKTHDGIPLLEEPAHQKSPDKAGDADTDSNTHQDRDRSPSANEEETVEPALHAATRSLYLKNFKRPLNIQTLRSHISTVAQGTSIAQEGDPIKFFNVNNIRSHAFVTFSSITAASRVRAAMHQTRFPDEPQREPLWVDFIPDEKVEKWVEQETGGTRAMGRNSATKLEVTYEDTGNGFEAFFHEAYPIRGSRPSLAASGNHGSAISQHQASYTADPTKTSTIASGIHPDRTSLVPRSPKSMRKGPPVNTYEPQRRSEDRGHGFSGLDDIFSSTQAKPKLYYKLPSQDVIDNRLDLIKDLYSDRGASGQPGMKRYTFEKDRGKDEWVDSGPEFGHGKRGQDRLAGVGGRGGRGNHYNGDSYRGGGRR